jgi:hypothetical protein
MTVTYFFLEGYEQDIERHIRAERERDIRNLGRDWILCPPNRDKRVYGPDCTPENLELYSKNPKLIQEKYTILPPSNITQFQLGSSPSKLFIMPTEEEETLSSLYNTRGETVEATKTLERAPAD